MDNFGQGTLIPTVRGNVAILTCIDLFTRFGAAFALPVSTAETTIVAVLSGWFYRFGPPSLILTDQGANFMSNSFHEFCTAWKFHHINTSPYHPQTIGACERFNGTIKTRLQRLMDGRRLDTWDLFVSSAIFAYNTTIHSQTGYTPFYMMFGTEARTPSEMIVPVSTRGCLKTNMFRG